MLCPSSRASVDRLAVRRLGARPALARRVVAGEVEEQVRQLAERARLAAPGTASSTRSRPARADVAQVERPEHLPQRRPLRRRPGRRPASAATPGADRAVARLARPDAGHADRDRGDRRALRSARSRARRPAAARAGRPRLRRGGVEEVEADVDGLGVQHQRRAGRVAPRLVGRGHQQVAGLARARRCARPPARSPRAPGPAPGSPCGVVALGLRARRRPARPRRRARPPRRQRAAGARASGSSESCAARSSADAATA